MIHGECNDGKNTESQLECGGRERARHGRELESQMRDHRELTGWGGENMRERVLFVRERGREGRSGGCAG